MSDAKKTKQKPDGSAHLQTEPSFHETIRVERARADRTQGEFALVVFEVMHLTGDAPSLDRFARSLSQRKRAIDSIGWLSDSWVGALLPGTNLEGGWRFSVDFENRLRGSLTPPPFTVWSYPHQWMRPELGPSRISPDLEKLPRNNLSLHAHHRLTFILTRGMPAWKRGLDILGALVGIAVCLPAWLAAGVWIKIVSPGPVLYRQKRIGKDGHTFDFLKIRTMHANNDEESHRSHSTNFIHSDVPMDKLDDQGDPRIIPGGKIIRKLCLDETPQFINILRGEMSLVGPRPCIPYEAEEYSLWHRHRLDLTPGLTGLWQVSGKNRLTFREMVGLDIRYMHSMSLGQDLRILLRTGPAILEMIFEAMWRKLGLSSRNTVERGREKTFDPCQTLEMLSNQ